MHSVIFYLLVATAVIPAIFVVTLRNVFHSALYLIVSVLGVAGLYAMLGADFIFAVQLLVYAGGIMVILLFVILLSGRPSDWAQAQANEQAWASALFSLFFIAAIIAVALSWPVPVKEAVTHVATTGRLGTLLLTDMILPFEVISLVLVAALAGAVYFSRKKPS